MSIRCPGACSSGSTGSGKCSARLPYPASPGIEMTTKDVRKHQIIEAAAMQNITESNLEATLHWESGRVSLRGCQVNGDLDDKEKTVRGGWGTFHAKRTVCAKTLKQK